MTTEIKEKSKTLVNIQNENPDLHGDWHIIATKKKEEDEWFEDKFNIARYCSIKWAEVLTFEKEIASIIHRYDSSKDEWQYLLRFPITTE